MLAIVCAAIIASGAQFCYGPVTVENAPRVAAAMVEGNKPYGEFENPRILPETDSDFLVLLAARPGDVAVWTVPAPSEETASPE